MKHRNTRMKTLTSCTFAFLLTLAFFTLTVCIGLGIGVFNRQSVTNKLNESDYYNNLYDELYKKADEIVLQAGLPENVLKNVITLEKVYAGSSNYVNRTLEGKKPEISTDNLKKNLRNNINRYLSKQGISQTDEVESGIDGVTERVQQEYRNVVRLRFINYYSEYKSEFWNLMKFVIPFQMILIGILCFFLLKIHRHKHRGLRYINYALISSSLLMTLISACMLLYRGYEKLNIMPYYYRDFLKVYFKWDIQVFLYIGVLGLVFSGLLISLTRFLKKRSS